jgi:hypothetical protein
MQGGDCAPVSIIKCCRLEKNSANLKYNKDDKIYDLIVARDDGRIEIYSYVLGNVFPTLCFECQIKSTITGIDVGSVTISNSKDVLISCFDGKIISLVD